MDSNYLVIDDYIQDPIEWEVERALRYLESDDYIIIPSASNDPNWKPCQGKGYGSKLHRARARVINSH